MVVMQQPARLVVNSIKVYSYDSGSGLGLNDDIDL